MTDVRNERKLAAQGPAVQYADPAALRKKYPDGTPVRVLVPRAPEDAEGGTLTLCLNGDVILLRVGDTVTLPACIAALLCDAGL